MSKPSPPGPDRPEGGDGDRRESGDSTASDDGPESGAGGDGQVWPSERVARRADGGETRPADGGEARPADAAGTGPTAGPGASAGGPRPTDAGTGADDRGGGDRSPRREGSVPEDGPGPGPGETPKVRALSLADEEAGELISSLSSETARSILVRLHEAPATASEIAESVGTSVQNVRHHLDNLTDTGAVEVSGTRYSSKGREMDVYAATEDPLVLVVGADDGEDDADGEDGAGAGAGATEGFVDSLRRFLGAVGLLAVASLLVEAAARLVTADAGAGIVRDPTGAVGGATGPVGVPLGPVFFAGGAFLLAVVSLWRFRRRRGDAGAAGTDAGSA